jgi:hypothetical protein
MPAIAAMVAIAFTHERSAPAIWPRVIRSPRHHDPAGAGPAGDDGGLTKMQHDFPGHKIWREIIPGRTVYVARSHHPAAHPHTVVTGDLRELHALLTGASQADGPR